MSVDHLGQGAAVSVQMEEDAVTKKCRGSNDFIWIRSAVTLFHSPCDSKSMFTAVCLLTASVLVLHNETSGCEHVATRVRIDIRKKGNSFCKPIVLVAVKCREATARVLPTLPWQP